MAETNFYSKGFDPVVGCSGPVAGVNHRKIEIMERFNKYGRKKPKSADVVKLPTYKPPR